MSDTPRTDDRARMPTDAHPSWVVDVDFARELERENARLRDALERAKDRRPSQGWQLEIINEALRR